VLAECYTLAHPTRLLHQQQRLDSSGKSMLMHVRDFGERIFYTLAGKHLATTLTRRPESVANNGGGGGDKLPIL